MSTPEVIPLRAFNDNYIWTLRDAGCAAVVDPGDARPVIDYLQREKLELVAILNTHHHADHVGGNGELLKHRKVPVFGPRDPRIAEVTHRLADGERFTLPHFGLAFEALEIPGHTRSHIAFYGAGMLFCGDTLFAAGCGRLFEGTPQQMHDSLARAGARCPMPRASIAATNTRWPTSVSPRLRIPATGRCANSNRGRKSCATRICPPCRPTSARKKRPTPFCAAVNPR